MKEEIVKRDKKVIRWAFILITELIIIVFICEWLIFNPDYYYSKYSPLALCVLIGNFGILAGIFAALLSTPYGSDDKERLTKVGSTLATLVTGYLLAKVIDPIISQATTSDSINAIFNNTYNVANMLVGSIGFLAGFLATYGFRAYLSHKREGEKSSQEQKPTDANAQKIIDIQKILSKEENPK